jgi:hypothetical protein
MMILDIATDKRGKRRFVSGMKERRRAVPPVYPNALQVFQGEMNHDGNNRDRHKQV